MKKQLIALFILIFTAAGLAAETGYQGHKWYESSENFSNTNSIKLTEEPMSGWNIYRAYYKKVQGERTIALYGFNSLYKEFTCVGYTISTNAAEKLKKELGTEIAKYKITTEDRTEKELEDDPGFEVQEYELEVYRDFFICSELLNIANAIEAGYADEIEPGEGTVIIYNYNDDTNVYIFENFYDKRVTVIYIPTE